MANMTYVGTHLDNGNPPNNTGCVTGFDQAGFVMGTSASLFNVSRRLSNFPCPPLTGGGGSIKSVTVILMID